MRKVSLFTIAAILSIGLPISGLATGKDSVKQSTNHKTTSQSSCNHQHRNDNKYHHGHGMNKMVLNPSLMMDMHKIYGDLNLTDAQKQSIQKIIQQQKLSIQKLHNSLQGMKGETIEGLYPLIATDKFDQVAFRKKIDEYNKVNNDVLVEMAKSANKMFNVLTAEQKAKMAEKHKILIDAMQKPTQ